MCSADTDIIIPVWNSPTETRECLAALVKHSPDARLILMDCGSDQETEQLLHEFAEFLDNQALLLRSENAHGFVETINRGLARATASLAIIMRTSSRVTAGWLDPLREASLEPDAGILVPRLISCGPSSLPMSPQDPSAREACHGSFAVLGITKKLHDAIGGFDERLDSGVWCLKDYSRSADRAGFRTLNLAGPPVFCREIIPYGSLERRERVLLESIASYTARWGDEHVFCAFFAPDCDRDSFDKVFNAMLSGARQGHRFFVFAPPSAYRTIVCASLHNLHDNISVEKLPRFFLSRACRSAFKRLRDTCRNIRMLVGMEGLLGLDSENGVTFAEFEKSISTAEV
jgi:glycosyltransferase involved in cell wall biosynthesis